MYTLAQRFCKGAHILTAFPLKWARGGQSGLWINSQNGARPGSLLCTNHDCLNSLRPPAPWLAVPGCLGSRHGWSVYPRGVSALQQGPFLPIPGLPCLPEVQRMQGALECSTGARSGCPGGPCSFQGPLPPSLPVAAGRAQHSAVAPCLLRPLSSLHPRISLGRTTLLISLVWGWRLGSPGR